MAWLLLGCSGKAASPDAAAPMKQPDAGMASGGGAPGSPRDPGAEAAPAVPEISWQYGYELSGCSSDAQCDSAAAWYARALAEPAPVHVTFDASECATGNTSRGTRDRIAGSFCVCTGDVGSMVIGPVGAGCFIASRSGSCLWDDTEFAGCDVSLPNSCVGVCDELQARLARDEAATVAATPLGGGCDRQAGVCDAVVQVGGCDDCCYDFRAAGALGVGTNATAIAHDCSLGVAGVIAESRAAWTEPVEPIPFFSLDEPSRPPGASKIFRLAVEEVAPEVAWMRRERPPRFSALAEAYDPPYDVVWIGVVLDPFEGVDDCGVFRLGSGDIRGGRGEGTRIPSWSLVDGPERHAYDDPTDVGVLNLDAQGVEPRFGGSYGVLVPSTGDGQVTLEGLRLPEALTVPASPSPLQPPGELALTWTGSGADPLRILLTRHADAVTRGLDYYVACEVADDGAFTIPAAALELVPLGPVDVELQRRHRELLPLGTERVYAEGTVTARSRLVIDTACDDPAVAAACSAYAEVARATQAECGLEPTPIDLMCPPASLQACTSCPESYACGARRQACGGLGFESALVDCSCPAVAP
jgi:hypothetical protein